MDPLSISSAIGGLVTVCGQTITTCRAIVGSIQDAPRILSSIQAECSTTREALSHIFMLINKSDTTALAHLSSNVLLSQSFDVALTGCTVTFSVLDNELDKVLKQSGSEEKLGFRQRAKFMWNEEVLKGAMEELRGQRDALNLLVTVVQSHSISEILDLLKAKSTVFQDVKRRTDSLYRPQGNGGPIPNDRWDSDTYSIFCEDTEKKFFNFDDDIMKSSAYRRVYSSIRNVQRPRRLQRTRLEPIVNLLDEEDLIDLRDHPPLIASYALELENELSPSSLDRRLSTQPSTTSPNITEDIINEHPVPIKSQPNQDCEPDPAFSRTIALEVPERLTNTDNPTEDIESQRAAGSPDKEEGGSAALDSADGLISTDGDGVKIIETGFDDTKLEETKSDEPISDKTTDHAVLVDGNAETTDAVKISKPLINTSAPIAVRDVNPAPESELTRPAMPSAISQQTTATYALEPINLPGNSDHFIEAAASGKSDSVREQLVKVWIRDAVLRLALLFASLHGHTDIVGMLLIRGIDVDYSQREGVVICDMWRTKLTPLHLAAANNKSSTIELLLKCGAKVDAKDSLGWTPLHFASARGCVSAVQVLLKHKAPIESGDSYTPLFVATSFGAFETAMILRDSGANTNVKAGFGFTLLHAAALGNCTNYSTTFKENLIFGKGVNRFRSDNHIHRIQLLSGSKPQSLGRIAHWST